MAKVAWQLSGIWWVFLLEGSAAILLGGLVLTASGVTLLALAVFLGFYWLTIGVLELVRAFVDRSVPWIWSLWIGILGIIEIGRASCRERVWIWVVGGCVK